GGEWLGTNQKVNNGSFPMMLRRLALAIAAMAAFAGVALDADAPVTIGFSLAKTGLFATATPAQLNAYHFWRDQVNAKGGLDVGGVKRQVEFVEYDDQSNPTSAVRIYE